MAYLPVARNEMYPDRLQNNNQGARRMRYAVWNNKGGVGKTFLSFVLTTEIAKEREIPVVLVDMCPQANLSYPCSDTRISPAPISARNGSINSLTPFPSEKVVGLVSTPIRRMSVLYTAIPALTGSLRRFPALRSPRSSVYTVFAL